MTSSLNKVCKLNGTLYEWNTDMKEHHGREGYEYGLIAKKFKKSSQKWFMRKTGICLLIIYR